VERAERSGDQGPHPVPLPFHGRGERVGSILLRRLTGGGAAPRTAATLGGAPALLRQNGESANVSRATSPSYIKQMLTGPTPLPPATRRTSSGILRIFFATSPGRAAIVLLCLLLGGFA
jgi:hypothetical protein